MTRSERKATMEQQLDWLGWELGSKRQAMEIAVAMLYNTVRKQLADNEAAAAAAVEAELTKQNTRQTDVGSV